MNFDFADVLIEVLERRASDLHLTAGAPPMVRVRGRLGPLEGYPTLTPTDTREIVYSIMSNDQRQRLETDWQCDFAYQIPGRARFRVNAYFQRTAIGAAFRLIPANITPIDQLGLPPIVHDFVHKPRGFVLFPPHQQHQVRVQLSVALQGIVTQQLLPTADGSSRCMAAEVLIPSPAVRNLIREGKTHQIYSVLQTSAQAGMQTMDSALATLVRAGKITRQLAEQRATSPEELKRLMGAGTIGAGNGAPPAVPAM